MRIFFTKSLLPLALIIVLGITGTPNVAHANSLPTLKLRAKSVCAAEILAAKKGKRPAKLQNCNLTRLNLTGADLRKANLRNSRLCATNLAGANLAGANLSGATTGPGDLFTSVQGKYDPACDPYGGMGTISSGGPETCSSDLLSNNPLLTRANFSGANLSKAKLTGADLSFAVFENANLSKTKILDTSFACAELSGAKFNGAKGIPYFDRAQLSNATFIGAILKESGGPYTVATDFSGADLTNAIFTEAQLQGSIYGAANLTGTVFTGALLQRADFGGSNLVVLNGQIVGEYTDFTGANLSDANFWESRFSNASFVDANVSRTNFFEAYLGGSDFSGAVTTDTVFSGSWMPDGTIHPCDKPWRFAGVIRVQNCGAAFSP